MIRALKLSRSKTFFTIKVEFGLYFANYWSERRLKSKYFIGALHKMGVCQTHKTLIANKTKLMKMEEQFCGALDKSLQMPCVNVTLAYSGFLKLHQNAITVFRMEKHHWFPVSSYPRLCCQSSDVLCLQVGNGGVDVMNLWKYQLLNTAQYILKHHFRYDIFSP